MRWYHNNSPQTEARREKLASQGHRLVSSGVRIWTWVERTSELRMGWLSAVASSTCALFTEAT